MEKRANGTVLVKAAEDYGGFERVDAGFGMVRGLEATIFGGMDFAVPVAAPRSERRREFVQDDISTKQRKIHAAIKLMRAREPQLGFQGAWDRLRGTQPELFTGMEPKTIHED